MTEFNNIKKIKQKNFKIYSSNQKVNNFSNCNKLYFGQYGLKLLKNSNYTSLHFKLIIKTLQKSLKKFGKIMFKKYPFLSQTKKSSGIRMGGGKGKITTWYTNLMKGTILFEIYTKKFSKEFIKKLLLRLILKIPGIFKLIILKTDNLFLYN